nr:SDR family oxidoreductase [Actinopolymorpha alba]
MIHLAAIPTPTMGTPAEVFCGNANATFVILEEAAQAGIRRVAFASSASILGLAWAPRFLHPAYVPIDEALPLQIEDPYALSKQADEATGAMMWRRYGMTVVALRYPFVGRPEELAGRAIRQAADPSDGARDLWTYLDVRDAARAAWLAVSRPGGASDAVSEPGGASDAGAAEAAKAGAVPAGFHPVFLAAPETLAPYPTEALLKRFHPGVERRMAFPGRSVPLDLTTARELLGFEAEHIWPVEPRELS